MAFSWIVGALITCTSLAQPTEQGTPTPTSVAALQLKTSAILDTLSYTAVVKSTSQEEFSAEPFRQTQTYSYSKRGTSLLLKQEDSNLLIAEEQYKNGKPAGAIMKVLEKPHTRRLMVTDEFTLAWGDLSVPVIAQYLTADWKGVEGNAKDRLLAYGAGGDVKIRCFGQSMPFHAMLSQSPEFTTWALTSKDASTVDLKRTLTISPQEKFQDTTLLLDARTGLLRSEVILSKVGAEFTCAVEYTTFAHKSGPIEVPKSYTSKSTDEKGAVQEELEIVFSDFKDESELPPYSFVDMGVPEGAEIDRRKPDGFQYFQWKQGKLEEIPKPNMELRALK